MENINQKAIARLKSAILKSTENYNKLCKKVEKHEKIVSEIYRSKQVELNYIEDLYKQLDELKLNSNQQ